ncbi:hypothetical protein AB4Z38_07470 [Arthrobacter sp. 2RAF6]
MGSSAPEAGRRVLGISHPCSLFDRWREIVAVSDDAVETRRPSF